MLKRILAGLIAVSMLFEANGIAALADTVDENISTVIDKKNGEKAQDDVLTEGDWKYRVLTDGIEIAGYIGSADAITIPDTIDGKNVTSIGNLAFRGCNNLEEIIIPAGILKIGTYVFTECSNLNVIEVALENLAYKTFDGCLYDKDLTEIICCPANKSTIDFAENVEKIGSAAFYECKKLKKINLPDGVKSIGIEAFRKCSDLNSIKLPVRLASIGYSAFGECSGLEEIELPKNVERLDNGAFYDCVNLKVVRFLSSLMDIGDGVFEKCDQLTLFGYNGSAAEIYAEKNGLKFEVIKEEMPTFLGKPTFNISGGQYDGAQLIEITANPKDALIYYTLDESDPSPENGILYEGAINIQESVVLKAVAVWEGEMGEIAKEIYMIGKIELASSPTLNLVNGIGGEGDEDPIFQIFPAKLNIRPAVIPLSVSHEEDSVGNKTIKVAIGIGKANWLDDESKWSDFVKQCQKVEKLIDKGDKLEEIYDAFKPSEINKFKDLFFTASFAEVEHFKAMPKLSVSGYFEAKYDKNGKLISSGGGAVETLQWGAGMTRQFLSAVGPLYLEVSGKIELKGKQKLNYDFATKHWSVSGSIDLEPKITLEGGYGVEKIVTIGAKATAALPMTIVPEEKQKIVFEGEASFHVYTLFGIWEKEYPFAKVTKTFYQREKQADIEEYKDEFSLKDAKLIDESYKNKTKWNPNFEFKYVRNSKTKNKLINCRETYLQEWGLLTSQPQIVNISGKTVMIFQQTDAERDFLNSTTLMYSVYENGIWSTPAAVWDNGKADYIAKMNIVDGKLYVTWQKAKKIFSYPAESINNSIDVIMQDMTENTEIAVANFNFDKNVFENAVYLTDDNKVDSSPKIIPKDNKPEVYWISNGENDITFSKGKNKIYKTSYEDGTWEAPELVYETDEVLVDFDVAVISGRLTLAVISQEGLADNAVRNTYIKQWGDYADNSSLVKIPETNESVDSVYMSENTVFFLQQGKVFSFDMNTHIKTLLTDEDISIPSTAKLYENNGKAAFIWFDRSEVGESAYIYASIKTENGFSNPIKIYENAMGYIQSLDAELLSDGSWEFIINSNKTVEGKIKSDMIFVEKIPQEEVRLEEVFINEEKKNKQTKTLPIEVIVTNTNEDPVTSLKIAINGIEIDKECNIQPGQTELLELDIDASPYTIATDMSISVRTEEQVVTNENTRNFIVGLSDTKLEVAQSETEEFVYFIATVENKSDVPTEGTVNVYDDVENGKVIASESYDTLSENEKKKITIKVEKSDLQYNEDGTAYFLIKDIPTAGDCDEFNNSDIKVTYKTKNEVKDDKIQQILLSVADASLTSGKTLQLVATIKPDKAANKTLKWTSSNEAVATVNDGLVYAVSAGEATITAESQDGSGIRASCIVTVTKSFEDDNKPDDDDKPGDDDKPDDDNKPGDDNKPDDDNKPGNDNKPGSDKPGGSSGGNIPGGSSSGGNIPSDSSSGNNSNGNNGNNGDSSGDNQPESPIKIQLLYYIVEFNANGGTKLSRKTMTLLNDDNLGILPKVQRENYIFNGWHTQKNGGTKVNSSTILNAGTTLFAQWIKVDKPSKAKAPSLKSKKVKQLAVSFQKITGAKGYEIAYSTNKKFPSSSTKKIISDSQKITIKKLKSGKKYYVKVRAYKEDSTGKKVYGAYSKAKSTKVK